MLLFPTSLTVISSTFFTSHVIGATQQIQILICMRKYMPFSLLICFIFNKISILRQIYIFISAMTGPCYKFLSKIGVDLLINVKIYFILRITMHTCLVNLLHLNIQNKNYSHVSPTFFTKSCTII